MALAALPVKGCAETSVATVLVLSGQRAISTKLGQTGNGFSIAVLPFAFAYSNLGHFVPLRAPSTPLQRQPTP